MIFKLTFDTVDVSIYFPFFIFFGSVTRVREKR